MLASTRLRAITPYGKSKVMVENDLRGLADERFSPTYLRNATVYGVSPKLRGDLVVNNLVGWAFSTGKVLLKSDGTPWRPLVHVEDVARAFLAVLEAPREAVHAQALNVGRDDQNFRIREIAEIVRSAARREHRVRGGRGPTRAATAWTSPRSRAACPRSARSGTCAAA